MKLSTIQKRENLNVVTVAGERGAGGAHHVYNIRIGEELNLEIKFQNGPRNIAESTHGVLDTDLLEIVRHRLQCFQSGDFFSKENDFALSHVEEALMWMNKRVEDRIERNVLSTYNK
jgi:hypothetical protein